MSIIYRTIRQIVEYFNLFGVSNLYVQSKKNVRDCSVDSFPSSSEKGEHSWMFEESKIKEIKN